MLADDATSLHCNGCVCGVVVVVVVVCVCVSDTLKKGGLKSIFFPVPWKRGVYTAEPTHHHIMSNQPQPPTPPHPPSPAPTPHFGEIWIKLWRCLFKKMQSNMSCAKFRRFCDGLNVSAHTRNYNMQTPRSWMRYGGSHETNKRSNTKINNNAQLFSK